MGSPTSRGWLRFPAVHLDQELRKLLDDQYDVNFKNGELVFEEEDRDIHIENGIFSYSGEVPYGELDDVEEMLVKKEIPFDRISFSDYQCPPRMRIFRLGWTASHAPNHFDRVYPLDNDSNDVVISVDKIREILDRDPPDAWKTIEELTEFLDCKFPPYSPLENFVPEIEAEKHNLKAAVEGIRTVDFSRFPGLYDKIPWAELEAAAGISLDGVTVE
jgi:hypothetical protein